MEFERIVWTENDVRRRLRDDQKDDGLYDCQAVQLSAIKYGYSSQDDGIPKKIYRLLKRIDLDRAMVDSLLPPDGRGPKTKKQEEYVYLYYLLKVIYIFDQGIGGAAVIYRKPRSTIQRQEQKAISIVTGWLNGNEQRAPKVAACKCG